MPRPMQAMPAPLPPPSSLRFFLYSLPHHAVGAFRGWRLLWHLAAIALTAALVLSGFDWWYFEHTRSIGRAVTMPGVLLGAVLPVLLPVALLLLGQVRHQAHIKASGWMLGQAALLGSIISSIYKALTGRLHPPFEQVAPTDISHQFNFGFLEHGIFWGWPSSHTAIAFAMAVALATACRRHPGMRLAALAYAVYVGLAVSINIHWFSDFVAGALIGTIIGWTVGKGFVTRQQDWEA